MTVVVVSTGGTIAMRPDPATGKLVPALSGDELVETMRWPDAPPLEGIVVAHGTDTMEETAYLIDVLLPPDSLPVILTGAQRVLLQLALAAGADVIETVAAEAA